MSGSIGEALEALLREADESFVQRCQERLEEGRNLHGELKFFQVDTLEEAIQEVLDLANYARFTYIKLYLLQRSVSHMLQQNPYTDREGFITLKEMFEGKE